MSHKDRFRTAVAALISRTGLDATERCREVQTLTDDYTARTCERPEPAQLTLLGDWILSAPQAEVIAFPAKPTHIHEEAA